MNSIKLKPKMVRMIYTGIVLKYVIMILMIIDEHGLCDTGSVISGASGLCTKEKATSLGSPMKITLPLRCWSSETSI